MKLFLLHGILGQSSNLSTSYFRKTNFIISLSLPSVLEYISMSFSSSVKATYNCLQ